MSKITKEKYEFALARIEELLPLVDDNTPANDRNAIELTNTSRHARLLKPNVYVLAPAADQQGNG